MADFIEQPAPAITVAPLPSAPAPVSTGTVPTVVDHGKTDVPMIPSPSMGPEPGQALKQLTFLIANVEKQLASEDVAVKLPESAKPIIQAAVDLASETVINFVVGTAEEPLIAAYANLQATMRNVAVEANAAVAIKPEDVGKSTGAPAESTAVLEAGDTVPMLFPRPVLLTLDHYRTMRFEVGVQQVPVALSTHPYLKLSGATIQGPAVPVAVPAAQPGEAALTAPVKK